MGILSKFFNMGATEIIWSGGSNTASGQTVTKADAVGMGAVYSILNIRSNSFGKLPMQVYQNLNGSRKRVKDHHISVLLEKRPNKYMTPFQFKKVLELYRLIDGVAFVRIEFKGAKPSALHFLNPKNTTVAEKNNKRYYTEKKEDNTETVYSEDEILVFPYFTLDGLTFKSPIEVAMDTLGFIKASNKYVHSYYKNGTVTRGYLKVPSSLTKENKEKLRREWERANSGVDLNGSKIAILDNGLEFSNITIPLEQAQWIESQKFSLNEVCRIFNTPPSMVGELEKASFNSLEQLNMSYYQETVQPTCICVEEESNFKLFSESEIKQGYYIKFNFNAVLRADSVTRANFYKSMKEIGAFSINEIRNLEEMDAIEFGDKHYQSLNFVPLELAEEYQKNKSQQTNN